MKPLKKILTLVLMGSCAVTTFAQAQTYQMQVSAVGIRPAPAINPPPGTPPATPEPASQTTGVLNPLVSADFGTVPVGGNAARTFRFVNTGSAAARVGAALSSGAITLGTNSCGTPAAPVNVSQGASCDVTVTYRPTTTAALFGALTVSGNLSNGPVSVSLSGTGYTEAIGALTADSSGNFGLVPENTTVTRKFTFRSSGNSSSTGVFASIPAEEGLVVSANTCGTSAAPVAVASPGSCAITLSYGGADAARLASELTVSGQFTGSPATVALSGSIGEFDATGTWSSVASAVSVPTPAQLAFGTKTTGSSTIKYFYVHNTGTVGAVAAGVALSGDTAHFVVTDMRIVNAAGSATLCRTGGVVAAGGVSASPCLAEALPSTGRTGVRVGIKFLPTATGNHTVTAALVSNNGTSLPGGLVLTGTGAFNPTAVWSSSGSTTVVTPTTASLSFGTKAINTSTSKTYYLHNTGTYGALATGFTLSGDTAHFKITSVYMSSPSSSSACLAGGAIAAGGASVTPCQAESPAGIESNVRVTVQHLPTVKGSHSVTLTPTTNNGTTLPSAIVLTGVGEFNPEAAWSSATSSLTPLTPAYLAFGTKTVGTATTKALILRDVAGTYGAMSTGVTLTGDTAQFRISSIQAIDTAGSTVVCAAGGVIAANGLSATPCLAELSGETNVRVYIRYAPTEKGDHAITVTPTTNNGTLLPGATTLTGKGEFNPAAVWSTASGSTVAFTSTTTAFGSKILASTTTKSAYLRNIGTNGAQAVGVTLSGATANYRISAIVPISASGTVVVCNSGGVIAADGLSATPCLADSMPGGSEVHVRVQLRFTPTSVGSHAVTLTATTNNGTGLPAALEFTGIGQ
jgi:hypothetical protein